MSTLQQIVDLLNSDPSESQKFQDDPLGYLATKSLDLPFEARAQILAKVKSVAGTNPVWNCDEINSPDEPDEPEEPEDPKVAQDALLKSA